MPERLSTIAPARRGLLLRRCLAALAAVGATLGAAAPAAAADVGVSIGIDQPGVYGRIDIGRFPRPQVIVQQPVVVVRPARPVQPVYLHVPPGHRKNWRKHCRAYGACGTPVYFVQERWYEDHVRHAPPAREERRHGDWRDGRHDGRHGDGHPGRGHGHGHGRN